MQQIILIFQKILKLIFTVEIEPKIESFKLERQNKKSNCGGLNGCKYAYDYQISYNIQLPKNEDFIQLVFMVKIEMELTKQKHYL